MAKIELDDTVGGYNISVINENFQKIEDELNNKVLYRDNPDGEANQLNSNIDVNGKRLYNLPTPTLPSQAARLQDVQDAIAGIVPANMVPFSPYGSLVSENVQGAIQELEDKTTYSAFIDSVLDDTTAAEARATLGAQSSASLRVISVRDAAYGAVGNASTDDRAAIVAADAAAAAAGIPLYFPAGVYRCSDGITKTAKWVGAGAPALAPFPLVGDNKDKLRPGYKDKIPGAVLLFTGTGTESMTTQRADQFASFTYCVRNATGGSSIEGIAIVCDVDVYDAGGTLTSKAADNSASYDVGYVIDDAAQNYHRDLVVFGYFGKAGTVIRSVLGNDDPDYNVFMHGSTMGPIGMALIGSESNDGSDSGLSGTQCYAFDIFSNDHHSRGAGTATALYSGASGWRCLYIDGYTDASNADINGHYFHGGCIRSYVNGSLEFDYASNVRFYGTVFETPTWGVTNSDSTQFIASAETRDVGFYGCRFSSDAGMYDAEFAGTMTGPLTCIDGPFDGVIVTEQSGGTVYSVRVGGASGGTADPAIQFLNGSPASSTAGWSIRRDVDASDALDLRWGGNSMASLSTGGKWSAKREALPAVGAALTVSSNTITVTQKYHVVDATGSPTITTISGGDEGEIIFLRKSGTGTVTLSEGVNIVTPGASVLLTSISDVCQLLNIGSNYVVVSFSDNA